MTLLESSLRGQPGRSSFHTLAQGLLTIIIVETKPDLLKQDPMGWTLQHGTMNTHIPRHKDRCGRALAKNPGQDHQSDLGRVVLVSYAAFKMKVRAAKKC